MTWRLSHAGLLINEQSYGQKQCQLSSVFLEGLLLADCCPSATGQGNHIARSDLMRSGGQPSWDFAAARRNAV